MGKDALSDLKKTLNFQRAGLGMHVGRQGLDAYGIRSTDKGFSFNRVEINSTRINRKITEKFVLSRLKVDKNGLQQGSRLYGQDRLEKAFQSGNIWARFVMSRQASMGRGRCWMSADYIYFKNVQTGEKALFRVFSNRAGNRIVRLKRISL